MARPAFAPALIPSDEGLASGTILVALAAATVAAVAKVFAVVGVVWNFVDEVAAPDETVESTD